MVLGVAFSPDGQCWQRQVLTRPCACGRGTRRRRNLANGTCRTLHAWLQPDGQMLATASADKTVRLWSRHEATAEPRILRGHEGAVYSVAFSPRADAQGATAPMVAQTPQQSHASWGRYGPWRGFSPDGRCWRRRVLTTVRLWSLSTHWQSHVSCGDGLWRGVQPRWAGAGDGEC